MSRSISTGVLTFVGRAALVYVRSKANAICVSRQPMPFAASCRCLACVRIAMCMCVTRLSYRALRAGDPLAAARRRVTVQHMAIGEKDRRSLKPLRDKAKELGINRETRSSAQRLTAYIERLEKGIEFKEAGAFTTYTISGVEELTALMLEEGVKPAPESCISLVLRYAQHYLEAPSIADFLITVRAWNCGSSPSEFDMRKPLLSCVPEKTAGYKFAMCQRLVFTNCYVPLLWDGADREGDMMEFTRVALGTYTLDDAIELDESAAGFLKNVVCAFRFVSVLLECPLDAAAYEQDIEEVLALDKNPSKVNMLPQQDVAIALRSVPFLNQKLTTAYVRAMPILLQLGG